MLWEEWDRNGSGSAQLEGYNLGWLAQELQVCFNCYETSTLSGSDQDGSCDGSCVILRFHSITQFPSLVDSTGLKNGWGSSEAVEDRRAGGAWGFVYVISIAAGWADLMGIGNCCGRRKQLDGRRSARLSGLIASPL